MENKLTLKQKLTAIQSELKAPKSQYNKFGKYKYRTCEDILEAVKPLLLKHDVNLVITDTVRELAGIVFIEASVVLSSGSCEFDVTAQAGIDVTRKGMDVAQCFGASSSYARKYALNGLFLIDDNKDADHEEEAAKAPVKPAAKKAAPAQKTLTLDQFNKCKDASIEQIKKVISGFKMTPEQRKELTLIVSK